MDALAVAPLLPPVVAPLKAASSILHSPGAPPLLGCVARLAHIVWEGTVESFGTIADHLRERLGPRGAEPFATPLDGKVCIVTGGNAGIGFATARALARRGAHVVLACRDRERAQAAAEAIARTPPLPGCCGNPSSPSPSPPAPPPPLSVEALPLDLGRMDSVRAFAADWRRGGRRLDLLVCNAGVMGPPRRLETADGLEVQFQVNFLSHWLLANQLLQIEHERRQRAKAAPPPSAAAASKQLPPGATAGGAGAALALSARAGDPHSPSSPAGLEAEGPGQEGQEEEAVRVVMVSSLTHRAGALQWGDKQSKNSYEPFLSYGLSKLANTLTARELQRRFDRSAQHRGAYTAVAVHPGLVSTALANGFFTGVGTGWAEDWRAPLRPLAESATECFGRLLGPLLMRTPDQSAAIMLAACLAPRGAVAGRYLALGTPTRPDEYAEDEGRARELWAYAQELTGCPPALD